MKNILINPIIWIVGIIASTAILGNAIKNRNVKEDSINVIGLGTKDFTSDEIYWSGQYSAKAFDAKEAYNKITADKDKVKAFFIAKGFKENEFTISGVQFEKTYRTITVEKNGEYDKSEQVFDGYMAKQTVSFQAIKNDALMTKIEDIVDKTAELINQGIEFTPNTVQYTFSNLPSLKHDLIQNATKDAYDRAEKIVKTGKGDLGKLKSASMGVFQITGKGSEEEDTYGGVNDTYSKEKTARITVRLTYNLD